MEFIKYKISEVPVVGSQDISQNRARIEIKPLEIGFAQTLGIALRRVCLSSIPGASMFAVKFEGHTHEFSAIEGVKDDIVNIVLNLKNLAIKIDDNIIGENYFDGLILDKWPKLEINFKGPGVLTAEHIKCPSGFEIINKDLVITEVTTDRMLNIEIFADRGRGRVEFTTNKERINSLNYIATDSNYSPVLHFQHSVEEYKSSKNSVSEILTIDIATNGTISGKDVVAMAAKILNDHLNPIININEELNKVELLKEAEKKEDQIKTSISIDELDLTVRAYNALKQANLTTTADIIELNKTQLEGIKNLGRKSVGEIIQKLEEHGLELKRE